MRSEGGEPVALRRGFLYKATDHELGCIEVCDHTLAERTDGADAFRFTALHELGFLADCNELVITVKCHDRRLVNHNLVVVNDYGVGRAEVDGYFFGQREKSHCEVV